MEYILNNSILALLEYPGATLLGVNRMLSDVDYRKKIIDKVTDPVVKAFWVQEFSRYTQRYETEATAAIQNKIGQFISNPLVRNIIGQVKTLIDMRKAMDEQKILIANISKGRIGEDNSRLLGALTITKLQLAAMSRVDMPEEDRKDFYLYVDEFQNFATQSFINILSEARKYRLNLILANQYLGQLSEMTATGGKSTQVLDAVFGNVGTMILFRIGAEDAEFMEPEFLPDFEATDLVGLGKYNIYLKLMVNGIAERPFSAQTLTPLPRPAVSNKDKIIKVSRERYGTPRASVEEKITKWAAGIDATKITSGGSGFSGAQAPSANGPVLYDARCASCGKDTKVIFQPDGKRPVYCKSCLGKMKTKENKRDQNQPVIPKTTSPPQEAKISVLATSATAPFKPVAQLVIPQESLVNNQASAPVISLNDAFKNEPVSFSKSKKSGQLENQKEKTKRREVNLEELKKVLEESLKKNNNNENPKGT
jgi:CxxC-x17-CxxC domain-containing protein